MAALLQQADAIKLKDPERFAAIMRQVGAHDGELSARDRQYFLFLRAWRSAYDGRDANAASQLSALAANSPSVEFRFRAYAVLELLFTTERRYQTAYEYLGKSSSLLPEVTDSAARAEGLLAASELYSQVGQYDLALHAAQTVIDDNWAGQGVCTGGERRLYALYNSGRFAEFDAGVSSTIATCIRLGQLAYANELRLSLAGRDLASGRTREALALLTENYPQAKKLGYSRQIIGFDALLALAYQRSGDVSAAERFALDAAKLAIPGEYPQPLIAAYQILYQLAKQRGDASAALAYHEQYTITKIGYLNDVSARQLAYERAKQENIARKLEIQSLSRDNRLLELEHKLAAKQMEATRLYGVILTLILLFIGFWAVLTKRSQLHFKSLSRVDGLTGISNRLHFIERAEAALAYARKSGQEVSLVLFDLDHFKSINDRFGHATGDFVLKRAAALCREYLRRTDLFGRFGGEEFSVLLPGCGLEEARRQADQLRQTIGGIQAEHRGEPVTPSASFGIASTLVSGYDLARLLAHADAALYRAKRAGRDCVMAYDPADSGEVRVIAPVAPQA
ncbi:MAG: GGDEF domain-containing protein [Gammaproteobacteria bacterium]|nr:GGDEF domain-containing protein [Gammaproteobacteria bacterium]